MLMRDLLGISDLQGSGAKRGPRLVGLLLAAGPGKDAKHLFTVAESGGK